MYKIIAIDIDGTLLNDAHEITPAVRDSIKAAKEKGVKVVLCTGRPFAGIKKSLIELDLLDVGDYAITFNGAVVLETASEKTLADITLNKTELEEIYAFCHAENVNVTYFDGKNMYVPSRKITEITCQDSLLLGTPLYHLPVEEAPASIHVSKVMLLDSPEKITDVIKKLPESIKQKFYIVRSVPYNLEFLQKGVNKGSALASLAEKLVVSQSEVMSIGDQENDITMTRYAGMGVAMGNATEHIKEIANYTTTTNNEDGVAQAIQMLVLDR
ncbi:sugar-phosphatase [Listeria monocytogenes]|nr:sugar-phosphatase [Listeria monocytogenes]